MLNPSGTTVVSSTKLIEAYPAYGGRSLVVEIASARATGPGSELFFFIFFLKIAKLGVKIRKIIKKLILVKFRSKNRKKLVF